MIFMRKFGFILMNRSLSLLQLPSILLIAGTGLLSVLELPQKGKPAFNNTTMKTTKYYRKIVVIGGGFAGLATVNAIKAENVEITVIDKSNHHLFQPLLYQ